jgi:hypothetical protein
MQASALKVGIRVKRDPRVWKKDKKIFIISAIKGGLAWIVNADMKKEVCVWTGKMVAPSAMPYQPGELVAA